MNGHLSALAKVVHVACQLVSHLLNREASPEEGSSLSVLRENHVDIFNSGCTTHACRLLTQLSHIEADSALSLGLIVHDVRLVHHDHGAEHLLQRVVIDAIFILLIDNVAILVKDAEALHLVEGAAELEIISELVLKHFHVNLVHSSKTTRGLFDEGFGRM